MFSGGIAQNQKNAKAVCPFTLFLFFSSLLFPLRPLYRDEAKATFAGGQWMYQQYKQE